MDHLKIKRRDTIFAVLMILACALLLRLYHLHQYDLWFDELGTEMFSSQILSRMSYLSQESIWSLMIERMKNDPHSSLYYVFIYFYSLFFGDGTSLRTMSVVFSMLSLGVFYKLSRLFFDRPASLCALLIMAFNPFHLWYAQEARVYAMACFFPLSAIYVYFKALKTDKGAYWICFPLFGILAVYSSYYSAMLLMIVGAALFHTKNRQYTRKWVLSLLIVFLSLVILQPVLSNQLNFVKHDFWLPWPSLLIVLFTFKIFVLGYSATHVQYWIGICLFSILFIRGVIFSYRTNKTNTLILLALLFLPIISVYIFSKLIMRVYLTRQLIILSPFLYLFIAKGVAGSKKVWVQTLSILGVTVLVTMSLINYYQGFMFEHLRILSIFPGTPPKKTYGDIMAYLKQEFREGDLIVATDSLSYMPTFTYILQQPDPFFDHAFKQFYYFIYPSQLLPYDKRFLQLKEFLEEIPVGDEEKMHVLKPLGNGRLGLKQVGINGMEFKRLWLISVGWFRYPDFDNNSNYVHYDMMKNFEQALEIQREGFRLELFIKEDTSETQ